VKLVYYVFDLLRLDVRNTDDGKLSMPAVYAQGCRSKFSLICGAASNRWPARYRL
jgi:hypothetical protein